MTLKVLAAIVGVASFVGLIFAIYFYNERHDARAEALMSFQESVSREFAQLKQQRAYDKATDYMEKINSRIWILKQRYGEHLEKAKDNTPKEEYRNLLEEKKKQELLIEQYIKGG